MLQIEEQTERTDERSKVVYVRKSLSKRAKKRLKWLGISVIVLVIVCLLFTFIGFPLIFMNSVEFQRLLMFTNSNLPNNPNYFRQFELQAGLRNLYVSVKDMYTSNLISLGVWHLLPYVLQDDVITEEDYDFDAALKSPNISIILYFHGTGEDRSSSILKYTIFRFFFHVITFDYRSYGDSSKAKLTEEAVVDDCLQLYEWLSSRTVAPIFLWGHSLGSALVTRTAASLKSKSGVSQPVGLVLEAAFTKMSDEIYVHPFGKIFAWLPWFETTVVKPLERNGFIFDTSKNILNVEYPIMILTAEDDNVVPYRFGLKLNEIAKTRTTVNTTLYYQFGHNLNYNHNYVYQDPFLPYFINYFHFLCTELQPKRSLKLK